MDYDLCYVLLVVTRLIADVVGVVVSVLTAVVVIDVAAMIC